MTFLKMHIPLLPSLDREKFLCVRQCVLEGRPLRGDYLESRTLSNKHSSLIIKTRSSWGHLLWLHTGREATVVVPERNIFEKKTDFSLSLLMG